MIAIINLAMVIWVDGLSPHIFRINNTSVVEYRPNMLGTLNSVLSEESEQELSKREGRGNIYSNEVEITFPLDLSSTCQ